MKGLWCRLKRLKSDILTLYYASKDPRVPWQAKALIILLAAYVISPIDILPDFVIPGLGYMDDILLISFGAEFILNMVPEPVISDAKQKTMHLRRRVKIWVLVVILLLIVLILGYAYWLLKIQ